MKVQKIEVKLNEKDITSDCKIDAKDHRFYDLKQEKILVKMM